MIGKKKISPEYRRYLQSQRWKDLRLKALKLAGNKCQECGDNFMLLVHHLRYTYKWRDEPVTDLRVLCQSCHGKVHHRKVRKWRKVKRIVVYQNGDFKEITDYKPFFNDLKNDPSVSEVYRIKQFDKLFS
jgi:hypothetical protein